MIKAILWDIDATLLNFEMAENYAIRECFSLFELGTCTDKMLHRYSAINRKYWERLERNEISKKEVLEGRFKEFFKTEGLPVEKAVPFNAEYQIRLGDHVFFNDNGYELVKYLKGSIRQYVVTNGTLIAQKRKLIKSGLQDLMDDVFISEEIGIEKPNIGFFEHVFEKIGDYKKEEIMIVGDSLTSDMLGGNYAGIICCWYNPDGKKNVNDVRIDYEISDLNEVLSIVKENAAAQSVLF